MIHNPTQPRRIAVIGGGMAGLAAAHRITELSADTEVTLFEASDRLGGVVRTIRQDGFLIESSADSFITSVPAAVDLCQRIGFSDQLISTDPAHRGALVVARGKLEPVPEGFLLMAPGRMGSVLRSPILSWRGKLRLGCERFVKARTENGDESVASFARRRLGREAFERLVQPLVGGIYTADPEKLSLAATLPRFQEMERRYGSLIRAATHKAATAGRAADDSGARYSMFVAPRDGLSSFVEAIAARLPGSCVRLNTQVDRIERTGKQWRLLHSPTVPVGYRRTVDAAEQHPTGTVGLWMDFDAVVVATPAPVASKLLASVDAALSAELTAIEHAGSAIVVLGYDRKQIAHRLDAFGFVVPAIERRQILSASFSSIKFPGRASDGKVLIRVFLGGALQPEMVDRCDDELRRIAEEELCDLLGISGAPNLSLVFRWHASMPQYHLGHLDRLQRINSRLAQLPGLALAGNAYEGVGIPQCIRSGEQAAESVVR